MSLYGDDAISVPEDQIECPNCGGGGEVGDNPSPIRDPQCEVSGPCPACHGNGALTPSEWEAFQAEEWEPDYEDIIERRAMRHEPSGDVW